MNSLEQTTQLAIDLIKKNKVTDFEFSLGKSFSLEKIQNLLPCFF